MNQPQPKGLRKPPHVTHEELIIPTYFASMGAIGAVLVSQENLGTGVGWRGVERLSQYLSEHKEEETPHKPLQLSLKHRHRQGQDGSPLPEASREKKIEAYLGIDVGSISTNLVVIDREKRVLAKRYLMTAGRPIEAVRQGLLEIGEEIGDDVNIQGVATTGSGRYLTADFVGADLVRNEITAQAAAGRRAGARPARDD